MKRVQEDLPQTLGSISVVHPSFCWRNFSQIASFPSTKASLHSQLLYKEKTELEHVISSYLHFPFNIISRIISFSVFASQVRYWKKFTEPWSAWSEKQEMYYLYSHSSHLSPPYSDDPSSKQHPTIFMLHLVYIIYICFTLSLINILEKMHQPRWCWKSWGSANALYVLVISDFIHTYTHVRYKMQQRHAPRNPSAADYTFP